MVYVKEKNILKKVLVFGPLGNAGGRDVEANIIAKSLLKYYNVSIISTQYMTSNSFVLNDIFDKVFFSTLDYELQKRDKLLHFFSLLSFIRHGCKKRSYAYMSNSFVKKYLNYNGKRLNLLYNLLKQYDVVILPVQLTTQFLKQTILFCKAQGIKTIVRTTGTIFKVSDTMLPILEMVDLFIHHSENNAANLSRYFRHPFIIIDQCAYQEDKLLNLSLNKQKPLRFGYLGRISEEKQILELASLFVELDLDFLIAGTGPQENELKEVIKNKNSIRYIGLLESYNIDKFFSEIDVLIISSKEETGPLVGVEALAAGKIIVSTRVGAMPERLRFSENDFWFSEKHVSSITEVIFMLMQFDSGILEKIGILNRNLYLENYSYSIINKNYINAISTILSRA